MNWGVGGVGNLISLLHCMKNLNESKTCLCYQVNAHDDDLIHDEDDKLHLNEIR